MKLLANENIPARALDLLRRQGVDIVSVLTIAAGLNDPDVLRVAKEQQRILVTFDKDFGDLAFRRGIETRGVILLRFTPSSPEHIARKMSALLDSATELENHFVVLDEERIRATLIRK